MKNLYKINFIHLTSIFFLILFVLNVPTSYATVSVDKATYYVGDPIMVTDDNEYTVLFNTDTNTRVFVATHTPGQEPTYDITSWYGKYLPVGHYSLLSFYPPLSGTDEDACTSYTSCKTFTGFVNEAVFNVIAIPPLPPPPPPPISAPAVVHGESFTPACGAGIQFFDVVDLLSPQLCGQSINLGAGNNSTYELRAFTPDFIYTGPSFFVYSAANSEVPVVNKRILPQAPDVSILSPKLNSLFSSTTLISYSVTDKNDLGATEEKNAQGLGINPVSIYYTDKSFDWNPGDVLINPDYKTFIAKDLPAKGQYNWPIKDLIPGNLYRIVVDATDNGNVTGEALSDYFGVDFTPPTFRVATDPALIKKGDVKISVESSKDLQTIPTVTVTQMNGQPNIVVMQGSKDTYEGTYTVQDGYDGTAKINVEGTDLAGNIGTELVNGGTFSIGVNPPPKPVIITDLNKTVTNDGSISLKGTVREDTQVLLSINGATSTLIKPDAKGNFSFDNIKLDKTKNKGLNYISVISRDIFGTVSQSSNIEIKYNIAPKVSIIKPTNGTILSNQADIVAKGTDENLDTLLYTYEIISSTDYSQKSLNNNWTTIATNIPSGSYVFDTTDFDDGDYMIRARVSDGYTTATSTPISVTVKNTLPYFRFENGRKTITNQSDVTIVGRAIISSNLSSTVSIKTIYYSTDGGVKWNIVKPDTTSTAEQKFSVSFSNLDEGSHLIMWRLKDSRDVISKGSHTIIIDKTAPSAPIIRTPKNNAVITDEDDQDLKKDGIQININGTAEAGSIASLVFNGQTLTTRVSLLGDFSFPGVTINKLGKQDLQFFDTDQAGNKSSRTTLTLIYNNPPIITFINPKPFRGLSGNALLSWNITDIDGDTIKNVEVSYRNSGGAYQTLVSNAQADGTYMWNTSKLTESSGYELKITATDSISPVSAVTSFFIDRTSPVLSSFSIQKNMVNKKIIISGNGTANDSISGIEYVEYSIKSDSDKVRGPWYKGTITKGYLQNKAMFTIKYPNSLSDNTYTVYARAVDVAGNISNEISKNIYVDLTSPRIGSFFIVKNNLDLVPDQDGNISFYKNSVFTFVVSIEGDTKTANLFIGDKNIKLNRNTTSGLWEATTTLDKEAPQDILITATDSSGNITKNKKMGTISGINNGNVSINNNGNIEFVSGAVIRVSKYNDVTGQYDKFLPAIDGVASVINTDKNGLYELVLPAGTYHLSAVKSGYKIIKKDITLGREEIVNIPFVTYKIGGVEKIISDVLSGWFY